MRDKSIFLTQKIPSSIVNIPSHGKFYPDASPLNVGYLEIRYPTAKQEDILTNITYLEKGIAVDKLIESVILTEGINVDDLLLGDKVALSISIRVLAYGSKYRYRETILDDDGNEKERVLEVDLNQLEEKKLPADIKLITAENGSKHIEYTLPLSQNTVTFQLMTQKIADSIEEDVKKAKAENSEASTEVSSRLKHLITSVEGETSQEVINRFVDDFMVVEDIKSFYTYYYDVTPGYNLNVLATDVETGKTETINLGLGMSFFWAANE